MTLPLIPIGIVAHHARQERAEKLAELLDAEVVSIDQGLVGPGRNHERCYEWLSDSRAPWVVLLEDDAMPVRNFRDQLSQVLAAAPQTGLLSLYLGRSRPPHWQLSIAQVIARDENFLLASELLHHVAVAIRPPLIQPMLRFIRNDTAYSAGQLPIDEAIGRWARSLKMPVAYCHPSIVDHNAKLRTVIRKHVSQHRQNETGERSPADLRKAWVFGSRKQWQASTARIPDPIMR